MIMKNRIEISNKDIGPNIIQSEFVKALNELKKSKGTGIDGIPAELLKNDSNIKSKIILTPKKGNSTECNNYCSIQ